MSDRTHDLSGVDIHNLAAVRAAVAGASAIGHWRRVLAIYGDHLPACASRDPRAPSCDCGWSTSMGDPHPPDPASWWARLLRRWIP